MDERTDTVHVAGTSSGQVSVINGGTCDASDTRGCTRPVAAVGGVPGAFPITVEPVTGTIYAGGNRGVAVIDGRTRNAAVTRGCSSPLATVPVSQPAGIAVDQATGSVYVSSQGGGTVTVFSRDTCSTRGTGGCAGPHPAVPVGAEFELVNAGARGVVYGFVQYHGRTCRTSVTSRPPPPDPAGRPGR